MTAHPAHMAPADPAPDGAAPDGSASSASDNAHTGWGRTVSPVVRRCVVCNRAVGGSPKQRRVRRLCVRHARQAQRLSAQLSAGKLSALPRTWGPPDAFVALGLSLAGFRALSGWVQDAWLTQSEEVADAS